MIFEGDEVEAALADTLQQAFFEKKLVGIGDDREAGGTRHKCPDDFVAPAGHGTGFPPLGGRCRGHGVRCARLLTVALRPMHLRSQSSPSLLT